MTSVKPHKATLGWAVVAIVIVVIGYHFMKGK